MLCIHNWNAVLYANYADFSRFSLVMVTFTYIFFFIFNSAEETEMVAVNGLGWVLKTGKHLGFPVGTRGYSHHVLCQAMQCSW